MKTAIIILCLFCAVLSNAQSIKQAEYFIDKDKGVGRNNKINLVASADSSYSFNVDLTGISTGIHKLYIRTKDSEEKWSIASRKNIEVVASLEQQKITAGEYFFDDDPGHNKANAITVSPGDTITENFAAVTALLKTGFHKLYTRFKDSLGNWSITSRKNIEIIRTADTIKIVEAEYFFATDKGYGKAYAKVFQDSLEDGKFKFRIPYSKIPANADTVFVRVKDSLGRWSLTKIDTFTIETFAKTLVASEQKINAGNAKKLIVFPNPAKQFININYDLQNKNAEIQIIDANGKTVLIKTAAGETGLNIDVSHLTAGSYILQLKDGTAIQSATFIKE